MMAVAQMQTTTFFGDDDQMGSKNGTHEKIQEEGITAIADLANINKEMIKDISQSLCKHGVPMGDPTTAHAPFQGRLTSSQQNPNVLSCPLLQCHWKGHHHR